MYICKNCENYYTGDTSAVNKKCLGCYMSADPNIKPGNWEPRIHATLNTDIVTGVNGGKQSKINTSFSLVPHKALLAIGKVMAEGAKKYPKDNWRKLTPDEIYDHAMEHLINWKITGDMEELEHFVTRASMLYEVVVDMEHKLEQMY
jgi:hypothetical protein